MIEHPAGSGIVDPYVAATACQTSAVGRNIDAMRVRDGDGLPFAPVRGSPDLQQIGAPRDAHGEGAIGREPKPAVWIRFLVGWVGRSTIGLRGLTQRQVLEKLVGGHIVHGDIISVGKAGKKRPPVGGKREGLELPARGWIDTIKPLPKRIIPDPDLAALLHENDALVGGPEHRRRILAVRGGNSAYFGPGRHVPEANKSVPIGAG